MMENKNLLIPEPARSPAEAKAKSKKLLKVHAELDNWDNLLESKRFELEQKIKQKRNL